MDLVGIAASFGREQFECDAPTQIAIDAEDDAPAATATQFVSECVARFARTAMVGSARVQAR